MIGLEEWFANFTQISRLWTSPEGMATIPRPNVEFAIWGMFKAAEVASVLGGCVAHPLYRFYLMRNLQPQNMTPNSYKIIRSQCRKLQGRFLLAGLFSGPLLAQMYVMKRGITEMELKNKCYKIRCDLLGLSMDRSALVCGFVGWYWKRFQGAVDGINVGLAYAVINQKFIAPRTSPILIESVPVSERFEKVQDAEERRSRLVKFLAEQDRRQNSDATDWGAKTTNDDESDSKF